MRPPGKYAECLTQTPRRAIMPLTKGDSMKQVLIPTTEPGEFKCRPCGTTVKGAAASHVAMSPRPHGGILVTREKLPPPDGRSPWAW
ncbi:hypothetical protein LCGC14_2171750 [marine sediment metagenome]|uniref:Uncharacterized protein n=1 Tax=marine sediment metagenome TaxID=412755 RepID=A0A0F9G2L6_9ZZZZ